MEEQKGSEFKEDFSMFIEAGFIAVKQLDEVSATRLFHAAHMLSPASTAPAIGLGFIALNKLEVKEATRIFEGVLQSEPENYLAMTFLGMCFLLTKPKRKKGEQIINEAMKKTNDPTVKSLGSVSLEWAEKDLKKLKKEKAPFFASKESESETEAEAEKE